MTPILPPPSLPHFPTEVRRKIGEVPEGRRGLKFQSGTVPRQVEGLCQDPFAFRMRDVLPPVPLGPDGIADFQGLPGFIQDRHPDPGDPDIVGRLHPDAAFPPLDVVDDWRLHAVGKGEVIRRHPFAPGNIPCGQLGIDGMDPGQVFCIRTDLLHVIAVGPLRWCAFVSWSAFVAGHATDDDGAVRPDPKDYPANVTPDRFQYFV